MRVRDTLAGARPPDFWISTDGRMVILNGTPTGQGCTVGVLLRTFLRAHAPFQDLRPTATCAVIIEYVRRVVDAASAPDAAFDAVLKAQVLATALNVHFYGIGGRSVDLTTINRPIGSRTYADASMAFGGSSMRTVRQLLTYAARRSNSGGSTWYGQDVRAQDLAKATFAAVNSQVALSVLLIR